MRRTLASEYPHLLEEWDDAKNHPLTPQEVAPNSDVMVWWTCGAGHEFQKQVSDRIRTKIGCSYCSNRQVLKGFNDLETHSPDLAREWHPTKNEPFTPTNVVFGSSKRFWWKCQNGHEWEGQLHSRVARGSGCKICAGQAPDVGVNDLVTSDPDLAIQWNHDRNTLKPTEVMRYSGKKVWWTCFRGHEFIEAVYNRSKGSGCATCSGRKLLSGFNDVETLNPILAKEWHPTKNSKMPSEVRASDPTKRWWICKEGHEFFSSRIRGLGECPYCRAKILLTGTNDLAVTYPELLSWWDFNKNSEKPSEVIRTSSKKFEWLCPSKGHSFRQTITQRRIGAGCPVCIGKKVLPGINDLASQNPVLAAQWDFERNSFLPSTVVSSSHKHAWWKCSLGHEWEASIKNRNIGDGCPFCGNRRLLQGFNDLASVAPQLIKEWDQKENSGVRPNDVCVGEDAEKSWVCASGHKWKARIRHRLGGTGCRVCLGQAVDPGKTDLATTHPDLASEWHPLKNAPLTPREVIAGTNLKLWWQCLQGHAWKTSGATRVRGSGCPACARPGFDPTKPGVLYFIRNNALGSNKVGITGSEQRRLEDFQREGWVVIQLWDADGSTVADAETTFFSWVRKDLGLPVYLGRQEMARTGGFSETFEAEALSDHEIITKIVEILNGVPGNPRRS